MWSKDVDGFSTSSTLHLLFAKSRAVELSYRLGERSS